MKFLYYYLQSQFSKPKLAKNPDFRIIGRISRICSVFTTIFADISCLNAYKTSFSPDNIDILQNSLSQGQE